MSSFGNRNLYVSYAHARLANSGVGNKNADPKLGMVWFI